MMIRRFEDIRAWQEARVLTKQIYSLSKASAGLRRDRRLREQMQAASVSAMSNIAEGFSRRTDKEFTQFLFVAKGSTAEVQSLFYVALDQEYLTEKEFSGLYNKADEVAKIISGFITSLLRQPARNRRK
jgi:four helix bundle protein